MLLYKAHTNRLPEKFTQLYLVDALYTRGTEVVGINRVGSVKEALDAFIG